MRETYTQFALRMSTEPMDPKNPWELYSTKPGYRACVKRLDVAMTAALKALDADLKKHRSIEAAALVAYRQMQPVLWSEAAFGAADSEGFYELARRINYHLSSEHDYRGDYIDRHDLYALSTQ